MQQSLEADLTGTSQVKNENVFLVSLVSSVPQGGDGLYLQEWLCGSQGAS